MPPQTSADLFDFIIVGAQKSGTTTLHEVLSRNSQLAMPMVKECDFFHQSGNRSDLERHFRETFGDRKAKILYGKSCPRYFSDNDAPANIAALNPAAKLVVILRDPVARTYSHYRMCKRRGFTTDEFRSYVSRHLQPTRLGHARTLKHLREHEADGCIVWSEYGRLLAKWRAFFAPGQMLILFTEELERNPVATYGRLLAFIGVEADWQDESFGKKFHQGGEKRKIAYQNLLEQVPKLRGSLRKLYRLLPRKLRAKFEMWNVQKEAADPVALFPETCHRLVTHFKPDLELVAQYADVPPDWPPSSQ